MITKIRTLSITYRILIALFLIILVLSLITTIMFWLIANIDTIMMFLANNPDILTNKYTKITILLFVGIIACIFIFYYSNYIWCYLVWELRHYF